MTMPMLHPYIKRYNFCMPDFRFYHPIEVRYGDLDPQGHLNNAKYLTYIEQARINYVRHLGLWDGGSFLELGMILAEVRLTFHQPVLFGQAVQVGVRVTRLGNKSLEMEFHIEDAQNGTLFASGSSVQVAYDYKERKTIAVPEKWRKAICAFEDIEPSQT
jgi:acyl-CoA thioester hydrolase